MKRIVTGIVLASLVILIVRLAPGPLLWGLVALILILATEELRQILIRLGRAPWPVLTYLGTLSAVATFLIPAPAGGLSLVAAVLAALVFLSFVRALVPTQQPAQGIDRVVGTLLPPLYLGVNLGHLIGLFPPGQPLESRHTAEDLVLLLLLAVYLGDTLAFFGGKLFGRRPMAPGISPKKTWEGAVSGLLGSGLAAVIAHFWFFPDLPLGAGIVLGVGLGVTGILGDLAESLLKRAAEVKDSGHLLPGHGGVLDRIDSLLLAAPLLYWFQRFVLA